MLHVTKRKLAEDLRDLGLTVSQKEDQSTRVCSPCSSKGSEAPGLNFLSLRPAFRKTSTTMIAFGLKECPHHLMFLRQGNANAMAEMSASLIPST